MTTLTWDDVGEKVYETGVSNGVLYIPNGSGVYDNGVSWNGLVNVSETPSGAEASKQYADNMAYLNLTSAEEFGATIEAFTYPDEFNQFDGLSVPSAGITVGQQGRGSFGFSYQTLIGNDLEGTDHGFKIHLVYGCTAAPSERSYGTVNESPEAITFSWELTTIPVQVTGMKPTAVLTVDSTKVDPDALADLMDLLYGTVSADPQLPLPDAVIDLFEGVTTEISTGGANAPTYNSGTHTITFPTVTGLTWFVDGVLKTPGTLVLTTGQTKVVTATPNSGYAFSDTSDDDWTFEY